MAEGSDEVKIIAERLYHRLALPDTHNLTDPRRLYHYFRRMSHSRGDVSESGREQPLYLVRLKYELYMSDRDELPEIDMTSQADQEFMDANAEPEPFDEWEHFWGIVEYYEERGWDASGLHIPGSVSEAKRRVPEDLDSEVVHEMLEQMQSGDDK